MTEQATPATPTPSKTSLLKKFFWAVGIIFALLGIDHFTYDFAGIGGEVTLTDSSIVVAPIVDTTQAIAAAADTTKDTTKVK